MLHKLYEFINSISIIDILMLKRLTRLNYDISLDNDIISSNNRKISRISFNRRYNVDINPFDTAIAYANRHNRLYQYWITKIIIDEENESRVIRLYNEDKMELELRRIDDNRYHGDCIRTFYHYGESVTINVIIDIVRVNDVVIDIHNLGVITQIFIVGDDGHVQIEKNRDHGIITDAMRDALNLIEDKK